MTTNELSFGSLEDLFDYYSSLYDEDGYLFSEYEEAEDLS